MKLNKLFFIFLMFCFGIISCSGGDDEITPEPSPSPKDAFFDVVTDVNVLVGTETIPLASYVYNEEGILTEAKIYSLPKDWETNLFMNVFNELFPGEYKYSYNAETGFLEKLTSSKRTSNYVFDTEGQIKEVTTENDGVEIKQTFSNVDGVKEISVTGGILIKQEKNGKWVGTITNGENVLTTFEFGETSVEQVFNNLVQNYRLDAKIEGGSAKPSKLEFTLTNTLSNTSIVSSYVYSYDSKGNIQQVDMVLNGSTISSFAYSYDDLGRLKSVKRSFAKGEDGSGASDIYYSFEYGKKSKVEEPNINEHLFVGILSPWTWRVASTDPIKWKWITNQTFIYLLTNPVFGG